MSNPKKLKRSPKFDPNIMEGEICGIPIKELLQIAQIVRHYNYMLLGTNPHVKKIDRIIDEWADENRKIIPPSNDLPQVIRNACRKQYMRVEVMESLIAYLYHTAKEEVSMIKTATNETLKMEG